jgi:archaellin
MNHNVTLAIVAVVAAMTLTAVAFAIPQQALASGNHYKHNNHNSNSIKVDQQINQLNNCTGVPQETIRLLDNTGSSSSTVCLNQADNSADIHR